MSALRRLLLGGLLLWAAAAQAAPWSSRWTVSARKIAPGDAAVFTTQNQTSLNQTSAQTVVSGQSITINGAGKTVTRTSGSYITDGYFVGQTATIGGSASGNNGTVTVTVVAALVLTVQTQITLTTETSSSLTVSGQARVGPGSGALWHTSLASQYTGATPKLEIQMDAQPVAGAAANALSTRTTWTLQYAEQFGVGLTPYQYHARFTAASDANVDALYSAIDIYFADATLWALMPTTAGPVSWFLDFGLCSGACLTGL